MHTKSDISNELQKAREWAKFFRDRGRGRRYASDTELLADYRQVKGECSRAEAEADEWFQNEGMSKEGGAQ